MKMRDNLLLKVGIVIFNLINGFVNAIFFFQELIKDIENINAKVTQIGEEIQIHNRTCMA